MSLVVTVLLLSGAVYLDRRRRRPDGLTLFDGGRLHLPHGLTQPEHPNATLDELFCEVQTITTAEPAQCSFTRDHRARYTQLQHISVVVTANLYHSEAVLPTFIKELSTLARIVNLHVVIVENGSRDETPRLLGLLARVLQRVGATYDIVTEGDDETGGFWPYRRIQMLANKRNQLVDLFIDRQADHIIFLNDVFFCASDMLELVYSRQALGADLISGVDYIYPVNVLAPYDTWVARDMQGRTIVPIGPDSGPGQKLWPPERLFGEDLVAYQRANELLPVQVFSTYVRAMFELTQQMERHSGCRSGDIQVPDLATLQNDLRR